MGLDMYAYSAARAGQYDDHWEQGYYDHDNGKKMIGEFLSPVTKPKELAQWRKHPNLHGCKKRKSKFALGWRCQSSLNSAGYCRSSVSKNLFENLQSPED